MGMNSRHNIVLLLVIFNTIIAVAIWLSIDPVLLLYRAHIYHILLWIILSLIYSSIKTSLPFGKASASLANIIDIAAIATVGPVPIITANVLTLM